ncbi:dihydroorotase family protein [Achromobacter sp. GD03932]|uniref:dihydroorotase n=1 Tax=unclassified Achromobacter TaxID=2626865 RepID=UPI00244D3EC2|nr:dihydroorotase family protein [Achromobacter sp. GD03932]MDH1300677.1 dihydroorotase family protein [Achromobacter sp. GD03932]
MPHHKENSMDTLIKNGLVVTPQGQVRASIGIRDGKIAGLYEAGSEPDARNVIDASGLAVLPGAIDMHSHHRQGSQKGFEYKDTILTATQQCAAGGVTTSVGMPNVNPPPNSLDLLEKQFAIYRSDAVVDWNFNPAPTIESEMEAMTATGIAAFKIFMVVDTGRDYPHMPGIGVHDHGKLLRIMQRCAELDVPLMVHPHDQALMDVIEQTYWDRGERDALAYARAYAAHDGVIWETAIATLLRLQKAAGCHLHILHTQTAGSVQLIREAKAAGQKVTCEINPWALFLGCEWSAIQRLGSYALSYWVPEKNVPGLWEGLNDGTIDIIATDHAPHTREEKEVGWTDGWKAHTGTPSTQFYLSMFLTAAQEGKISLERVAEACSAKPAELFRLRSKGEIRVGLDADLVLVDLETEYEVRDEDVLSLVGWSPYAGRRLKGKPVHTLVRGATVYADGKVVGAKGGGQMAAAVR